MARMCRTGSLLFLVCLAAGPAEARTRVKIDVNLRHDQPRITRYRRVRRFGWHSGTHYGPYVDGNGRWRVGWHTGSHKDWYTIDLPVLDKVDRADWDVFVKLGKDKSLRVRGDLNRTVRHTAVVQPMGGALLGWVRPDGTVIAGGPATPFRKRFVANGWEGFDLGNSIILMDLPGSSGARVYLKQRTRDLGKETKTERPKGPAERLEDARRQAKRDRLLDEADQTFARALYPRAALLYHRAIKLDPTDAIARFAVAHCLFALGVYGTAGENVRLGLDQFPEWGTVDLDLRKFYTSKKLFHRHLAKLKKYVADHPDDADARLLFAYGLYFSGSPLSGMAQFKALAGSPAGDKHAELFVKLVDGAAAPPPPGKKP